MSRSYAHKVAGNHLVSCPPIIHLRYPPSMRPTDSPFKQCGLRALSLSLSSIPFVSLSISPPFSPHYTIGNAAAADIIRRTKKGGRGEEGRKYEHQ